MTTEEITIQIEYKKHINYYCIYVFLKENKIGSLSSCMGDDGEMVIIDLFIDNNYRKKGFATLMLWTLYEIILNHNKSNAIKIKNVTLTDCSDHFNRKDNVYYRVGFFYNEDGYPEMEWPFTSKKIKSLYKKYKIKCNLLYKKHMILS